MPDVSRYCLSCGKEIPPPKMAAAPQQQDPDPTGYAMMCFGLAFMMFFFALVPMFLGLWLGVIIMTAVGVLLVLVGYSIIRSGKKQVERIQEKAAIKLKCHYCGSLNEQSAIRCEACGATL